jgi:hypothetical protein
MGVSSAQAKALIHRAKGTFRRAWSEDRRGIAALAPWFLIPNLFRRAADAAQTVGGRVAATPAVAEATATTAEKVTAAAVAIAVAGTVGVGAIAVRHSQRPAAKPSPVVAAPAPSVAPATTVVPIVPPKPRPVDHHKQKHNRDEVPVVADPTSPSAEPSVSPDPSPDPSPSGDPSPGPVTPPVIGPAPAWGMNFTAGTAWAGSCADCPAGASLVSSNVSGTAGESVSIAQVAQGSALDSTGRPAWRTYVQYWGSADGTNGQLQYQFRLQTAQGWYTYSGGAVLMSVQSSADGGYIYAFSGGYHLDDAPGTEPMPHQGSLQILVHFWPDGTSLYATDIALSEV